jgi:hypothetical protein
MTEASSAAPSPTHRLIPSRFPPIGLFDTVATAADLSAVMDLAGWTNDRLVAERLARLPESEWAYGRPNASVIMAAFLHVAPGGMRFNGPDLGAWYASAALNTAAAEVAHHLRREAVATGVTELARDFRAYRAGLGGAYTDLRGPSDLRPDIYAGDSYAASQTFGEALRAAGEAGVIYDSLRHGGGVNVAAFRPSNVQAVVQAEHYRIRVRASEPVIEVRKLAV